MTIKSDDAFIPKPGLYLVATPIGNRRDITLRALDVLSAADVVLCEDTRVTGTLLSFYGLKKPLLRCDDVTERKQTDMIMGLLAERKVVALCSDAGSPLISDPGYPLVLAARAAGHLVTTLPGASSVIAALQIAGIAPMPFAFLGFAPQKGRKSFFEPWAEVPTTLVLFDRANRLNDTIAAIREVLGERDIVLTREITKMFEEVVAIESDAPEVKGECVLIVGPPKTSKKLSRNDLYKLKLAQKHGEQS